MPPVHTFFRDTLFKNRRTFPTKSVDVDFKKGSRALAPFVHPKVGGKVIPNSGYQYNEWYLDNWTNPNAPAQKPLVPDGTLALLSTEAEYSIYYGAITMIPEEGKTFVTVEGDRVPQTWVERRPDRRFLQVNSKPLTVPHEVNSWYVAKVL